MQPILSNRLAANSVAGFVFLLSLWRAWTQSITGDEAFAFDRFVSSHPAKLFNQYDASHHVLYAILQKISVTLLGVSELTLRLPALAGAALYLTVVLGLCRKLLGDSPRLPLAVALLTLNPLALDFLSAARGYGLALALFVWALTQMCLWAETPSERFAYRAAVGLGLSVSANLTFAFPSAPAALVFLGTLLLDRRVAGSRWRLAVECFLIPLLVVPFLILVMPLVHARREHFYVGHDTFDESLRVLAALSLFPHPKPWAPSAEVPWVRAELQMVQWVVTPFVLLAAAGMWIVTLREVVRARGVLSLDPERRLHLFAASALLGALLLLFVGRRLFALPYPHGRTGLYLIVLAKLCALTVWRACDRQPRARWLRVPAWAVAVLLVCQYLVFLQTRHYSEWRYDASTKNVAALLRARVRPGSAPARIAASPFLEPSLNFYRKLWRMDGVAPVRRESPDREADYYVLLREDHGLIARRRLRVLFADALSGVAVAVPRDRMAAP
ncbi:MAG: hypothetical protein RMK57_12640 [Bryobacterales bacterium]|nr:hypothetical protein [Bryobacteraceae bacterium]MDW8355364.1 hypothetical protein [Bryobacterales bacterium]